MKRSDTVLGRRGESNPTNHNITEGRSRADLRGEVHVRSSVQQQLSDTHVLVVSGDVERRESGLQRHHHSMTSSLSQQETSASVATSCFTTLLRTSALGSFCSSTAAVRVSSFRAAMCSAGSRTFPLVP